MLQVSIRTCVLLKEYYEIVKEARPKLPKCKHLGFYENLGHCHGYDL